MATTSPVTLSLAISHHGLVAQGVDVHERHDPQLQAECGSGNGSDAGRWRASGADCARVLLATAAALGFQLKLQPEKDIFLFNAKEAVANWTASSDRSIGGRRSLDAIAWVALGRLEGRRRVLLVVQAHVDHDAMVMKLLGLSECKWGFYTGTEGSDPEQEEANSKRLIRAVNNKDDVPSGEFKLEDAVICSECGADGLLSSCVYWSPEHGLPADGSGRRAQWLLRCAGIGAARAAFAWIRRNHHAHYDRRT
ncbi:unnamed protein product [Phytophthora fragariaefolia]|uniref:Unnamed protein product n=1 Tax=Phytophthora fragariaefolia TaxID=1490495 RepID=A0A9W6XR97_9STRA|nr:unnamed protein product [Phytophthora fragariaefolia]